MPLTSGGAGGSLELFDPELQRAQALEVGVDDVTDGGRDPLLEARDASDGAVEDAPAQAALADDGGNTITAAVHIQMHRAALPTSGTAAAW